MEGLNRTIKNSRPQQKIYKKIINLEEFINNFLIHYNDKDHSTTKVSSSKQS